jgi:hypothetical protein
MATIARRIEPGSYLRTAGGVVKVLVSCPEPGGAQSGSSTQWLIVGYAEGEPTRTIVCDPESEFED